MRGLGQNKAPLYIFFLSQAPRHIYLSPPRPRPPPPQNETLPHIYLSQTPPYIYGQGIGWILMLYTDHSKGPVIYNPNIITINDTWNLKKKSKDEWNNDCNAINIFIGSYINT